MKINKKFESLHDCIIYLNNTYPENAKTRIKVKNVDSSEHSELMEVPKYFYRGESKIYNTTLSSLGRIKEKNPANLDSIISLLNRVNEELQIFLGINYLMSEAFMQHYGLPTEMFDITQSLDVASYFASSGEIEDEGLIAVLQIEYIHDKLIIVDLTKHPNAERPRRQKAYGMKSRIHPNIKSDECQDDLNIIWFSFKLKQNDKDHYNTKNDMLNAFTDKVAGVIQIIVDSFDKLDDSLAKWLSEKVIPAPFVGKVIDFYDIEKKKPKTIELVSTIDAKMSYDVEEEKLNNYKKWSILYPETRQFKMKNDH